MPIAYNFFKLFISVLDCEFLESLRKLEDTQTSICCLAEREFIAMLDGGCQVPIGVFASITNNTLNMQAIIGLPNGSASMRNSVESTLDCTLSIAEQKKSAKSLAQSLAKQMIANGAKELLARAYEMAQNT